MSAHDSAAASREISAPPPPPPQPGKIDSTRHEAGAAAGTTGAPVTHAERTPHNVPTMHALRDFAALEDRLRAIVGKSAATLGESALLGNDLALFLDYDGTLTPIVSRPELAVLSPEMRQAVLDVSERLPLSIVSGRGKDNVHDLVGVDSVYYAGSHGFDIAGPSLHEHKVAGDAVPVLRALCDELRAEFAAWDANEGIIIEDKTYSVAIHYRLVPAQQTVDRILDTINQKIAPHREVKLKFNKCVYEIVPNMDWHKGKAVLHLLDFFQARQRPPIAGIYIGDDRTDEDAFFDLAEARRGIGILVCDEPRPSFAEFVLHNVGEVHDFLRRLCTIVPVESP